MKKIPANQRLIVALDVKNQREALRWVKKLMPVVKVFKVGLELFTATGPKIVEKINNAGGKVFLDLKFFDIPNTMAGAVASSITCQPLLLNVHALAGPKALRACSDKLKESGVKTKLIAVTILTSYDDNELEKSGIKTPIKNSVNELCRLTLKAGLAGVVASPLEVSGLRKKFGDDFLIVTPGVRPVWADANDQKRIATPYNAIKDGADYIVVGRPILQSNDPLKSAKMIQSEIRKGLK